MLAHHHPGDEAADLHADVGLDGRRPLVAPGGLGLDEKAAALDLRQSHARTRLGKGTADAGNQREGENKQRQDQPEGRVGGSE